MAQAMDKNAMDERWLTVGEAAGYLGVSRRTIFTLCAERGLASYRAGERKHRRFKKADLDLVLKREEPVNRAAQHEALSAKDDPLLAEVWDNAVDSAYDCL
jgi:excisionase family DNA binding protein